MPRDSLTQDLLHDKGAEVYKALMPSTLLKSAGQRFKATTERQIERAEQRLQAIVRESLGKAAETLKEVSRAGPAIGHQLNTNLGKQLSPEQLDTSARTYERLIASSRSQLGLDSEQQTRSAVQISILSNIPS